MVVRLFFTNGTDKIRSFTDEELINYKLTDKLKEYFTANLWPDFPIDSYELFDINEAAVDLRTFDLREYFNYSRSFIGLETEDGIVSRVEFFDKDNYEYNLDYLGENKDPYMRKVGFVYNYEEYYLNNPYHHDPENC